MPLENRFIYKPLRVGRVLGLGNDVELNTADGEKLHARYVVRPYAYFTLLYLHGRSGNLASRARLLSFLSATGANVFAIDYRGYGTSTGTPTEAGLNQDALTAYQWLIDQGAPASSVIAFGEGLGAAPACELAATQRVGALALLSAFTSLPALASARYPHLPTGWVVRSQFDVLSKLKSIGRPKLIAHSREDEKVPFTMGEQLFAAASDPKQALWLDGAKHGEVYATTGQQLSEGMTRFIAALPVTS
jgi:fermentation-respiration switch protein FrsA (DUF1100 family)